MTEKVFFDPVNPSDKPIIGVITAWSFSRLKVFENCHYDAYLRYVKKVEQGETGPAGLRGIAVHTQAEEYISGKIDKIEDTHLKTILKLLDRLREAYGTTVKVEEQWGFDIDWNKTGYFDDNVWCRLLLDVIEFISETDASVIDWKTGGGSDYAKFKYADQMMVYAIITFLRYPKLEFIETKLVFVDKPNMDDLKQRYTRDQAMLMLPRLEERALAITTASSFSPNPTRQTCRFCPYKENGECEWAYEE